MRALILGQSKTGTTALMASVAAALGGARTVLEPDDLRAVDLGDGPVVVKKLIDGMLPDQLDALDDYDTRLLLTRDPRDRFVSFLLYDVYGRDLVRLPDRVERWLAHIRRKEANPRSISLVDLSYLYWQIAYVYLPLALGLSNNTLLNVHNKHESDFEVMRYEDLIRGDYSVASEVLGAEVTSVAVSGELARVARSKSSGEWRNWFCPSDYLVFRPTCQLMMNRFGYGDDWVPATEPVIDPTYSSEYVQGLWDAMRAEAATGPPSDSEDAI